MRKHGIQLPAPSMPGLLAEWLRYSQVISLPTPNYVRLWCPRGIDSPKQWAASLPGTTPIVQNQRYAVEFELPDEIRPFLDILYHAKAVTDPAITIWCPTVIGRPKQWQIMNIGRLKSYSTDAIPVTG